MTTQQHTALSRTTIWLVYDGDCPICAPSANAIKIKQAAGRLELVNARKPHPLLPEIEQAGLDLNQGFVVKANNQFYHGADAMHFIAMIGTKSGWFNRINVILFSNKLLAKFFYPIFRAIRKIVLKLNRIPMIDNRGDGNERE